MVLDGKPGREPGAPNVDLTRGAAAFSGATGASAGAEVGFWVTMFRSLLQADARSGTRVGVAAPSRAARMEWNCAEAGTAQERAVAGPGVTR
jgi:hypothetical protein